MAQDRIRISIVAPAYDEEEVLPYFHAELCRVLGSLAGEYDIEILYVDDGSRDGTLALLRGWSAADVRVRYLSFSRNFGHQAAYTAGLEHARGDALILLDSDLQHPPALIPALLQQWRAGADVVVTQRISDQYVGLLRRLAARCFGWLYRRWSRVPVREDIADYCLLSRRATDSLLAMRETHRYLRGLVRWLGFPTAKVPFEVADRKAGVSKFSPRRLADYALDALLSFSRVPLRLPFFVGLLFLLIGLGIAGGAVLGSLGVGEKPEPRWTGLLVSLYLIGGAILCALGTLGEYLGRVYEQVKGRPLYLLKETEASAAGGRSRGEAQSGPPPSAAA
jgi:polyisoprenyl-phosphate glycosyltransferase